MCLFFSPNIENLNLLRKFHDVYQQCHISIQDFIATDRVTTYGVKTDYVKTYRVKTYRVQAHTGKTYRVKTYG